MSVELRFGARRGELDMAIDLALPARGVSALFGPSGCGKTSLLRVLAGLDRVDNAHVAFDGDSWQSASHFTPPHRRPLGFVFQHAALFEHLDVRANIGFGFKRLKANERRIGLDEVIELLDLGGLLRRRVARLSGGEKQRVAIARALAASPRLLLMDEPLASLDQGRKQEILPRLESLNERLDIPVIYVSHSSDEVARLADHMVLMSQGRISAQGPVSAMLTRLDLPLATGEQAESLLEGVIDAHDDQFGLSYANTSAGRFTVPGTDLPVGSAARLRILARDVSLTLDHQSNTSILNIFPATVIELAEINAAQIMVKLDLGGAPLLARITRKSVGTLGIRPGVSLYAQVKSVALLA